ncbi:hypothetical protein FACS1894133_3990 [Clostridia bacterium]|nr:hypothetical protein FACS1894133_3990 [Clostridia bacterium]
MTVLIKTAFTNARIKISKLPPVLKKDWWVLLCIVAYYAVASMFLGTGCFIRSSVGLPCPGCGVTRAGTALLHGDIHASLFYHPLLIPSAVILTAYLLCYLVCSRVTRVMQYAAAVLGIALAVTFAVRMVALFPHTEPMVFNTESILGRIVGLVTHTP